MGREHEEDLAVEYRRLSRNQAQRMRREVEKARIAAGKSVVVPIEAALVHEPFRKDGAAVDAQSGAIIGIGDSTAMTTADETMEDAIDWADIDFEDSA